MILLREGSKGIAKVIAFSAMTYRTFAITRRAITRQFLVSFFFSFSSKITSLKPMVIAATLLYAVSLFPIMKSQPAVRIFHGEVSITTKIVLSNRFFNRKRRISCSSGLRTRLRDPAIGHSSVAVECSLLST